ncbi:ATPase [Paraurantiacibacter namhicola]|uniref:Chromosome partition protein Smc n=1 Tax=Paraurantiacibacter namhicola TaxID=645517 RepID=A0A1C7D9V0_9SPHN|nr:ATPase [Paraurantiacibacter namhicola]ANU08083.1 Chromosome partition protein Smc [Paraurantiacibacter namhicola]
MAIGSEAETAELESELHGADTPEETQADDAIFAEEEVWEEDEMSSRRSYGWLIPALCVLAIIGWTAFFGWVHQAEVLGGADPRAWSQMIVDWSVPVLLALAIWLLSVRNSRREAKRFGEVASSLSEESARLETRLSTVNRELSLARDFIAAQSRDLESLGRVASERISGDADRLQTLIHDNGAQVDRIGSVSTTALENMERLRDDLPVISNSARDVANQIGHAGETANGRLEQLVNGFKRLNEFGEASESQVESLRVRVDELIAAFEAQLGGIGDNADARFASLAERSDEFRTDFDSREVEALAAFRRRADDLKAELEAQDTNLRAATDAQLATMREMLGTMDVDGMALLETMREGQSKWGADWAAAIDAMRARMQNAIKLVADTDAKALENAQAHLDALTEEAVKRAEAFDTLQAGRLAQIEAREQDAASSVADRMARFDAELAERQEEQVAHISGITERGEALAARLARLSEQFDAIQSVGAESGEALDATTLSLTTRLADARESLESSRQTIDTLTNDSVRLLELIRGSAEHVQTDLPQALADAQSGLEDYDSRVRALHELLSGVQESGADLSAAVEKAREDSAATGENIETLQARIGEAQDAHAERLGQLEAQLEALAAKSDDVAQQARAGLGDALEGMADDIGRDSATRIESAIREQLSTLTDDLEAAAERAGESSRETIVHLRDQLSRVNELAGNLESRVSRAREQAEEQVDNDFARRVALITDALNSSGIDIARAMSSEVTDTAWASYLRGDRGIFTRRAVKLLDTQEVRDLHDIYDDDPDFRETVNRYIHDFEAMLRSVLSTRDGNALAVTLLSSDMGKLYVALAQAIDRLRD